MTPLAKSSPWWLPLLLFLGSFSLYLLTLAPTVVTLFDDSLEFQLVTYQLGIAHPTGYPLYTMLGKLATLLIPLGDIAYRVNLLSAVCAALTIALLSRLLLHSIDSIEKTHHGDTADIPSPLGRGLGGGPTALTSPWATIAAALAALLLALSPIFWQQATIAEVYSLNALFVSGGLLLTLRAGSKINPEGLNSGAPGLGVQPFRVASLLLLAGWLGLSLTHHRTMVLLMPAVALYLLRRHGRAMLRPGLLLRMGACFGLPLLLYLYLPLRGHVGSLDGSYQQSWAGFWQHVTASGYGSAFLLDNPFAEARGGWFYLSLLGQQFGWTSGLAVVGLGWLIKQRRVDLLLLTGLTAVSYTLFNLFYNVADIEVFFIPVFIIGAIWIGWGVYAVLSLRAGGWPLKLLLIAGLMGQLGWGAWQHQQPIQARNQWTVHDYGLDMVQSLPPRATVIGIVGEMTLLRYFQQTEGLRPHVQTIAADREAARWAAVTTHMATIPETPLYLTRELPDLGTEYALGAAGPLIRVWPQPPTTLPAAVAPIALPATTELSLRGYMVSRPPHTPPAPAPLRLTLYWQRTAPLTQSLKLSARLLDSEGAIIAMEDRLPVHFAYPTLLWRPSEIVRDGYDLPLPSDLPPANYTPLLIWYDPARNAAEVGRITLPPVWLP